MVIFRNITPARLLKSDSRGRIKATISLVARNPSISALWFVAIDTGGVGCLAYLDLKDAVEYPNNWKMDAIYQILKAGFYCLISVVSAGFALVLMSIKRAPTQCSLAGRMDVEVPDVVEEMRLERQAQAAEKRFNDGDTTAREYRTAIAEIEKRRWQLRTAAASRS